LEHCISKMISTVYRGLGHGCVAIATEAIWLFSRHTSQKLLVFNEMVITRPNVGWYRLVKAEDGPFIVFQSRYQLCSGTWVLVGMI
jgi:hypothetical protein